MHDEKQVENTTIACLIHKKHHSNKHACIVDVQLKKELPDNQPSKSQLICTRPCIILTVLVLRWHYELNKINLKQIKLNTLNIRKLNSLTKLDN